MRLTAVVQNAFDEDPPLFLNGAASPAILYDPQNASPYGRMVSLRLSKAF